MIVGTDVVEHDRFRKSICRNNGKLRQRLFRPDELSANPSVKDMAVFFSVKESVAKAMGTGFDVSLSWHDIKVSENCGKLQVTLSGRAAELAGNRVAIVSASSSDTRTLTCVILAERS
ncbi:hypothetical protein CSA37_09705 [Candidatus Fermentibacteria bacterium]|nr:MAG: hypothetical protein CSA37_09705 [Candidatus Fermentibacteria bacterium]